MLVVFFLSVELGYTFFWSLGKVWEAVLDCDYKRRILALCLYFQANRVFFFLPVSFVYRMVRWVTKKRF